MDDCTYTFVTDIRDKKTTARSARNRVVGSRSRKCTLPSDYMTKGELKKMSGTCHSICMNAPTTYKDFKALPITLQREYVEHLFTEYDASIADLAGMFNVTSQWFGKYIKTILHVIPPKAGRRSALHKELWEHFLAGDMQTPAPAEDTPDATTGGEESPEDTTPAQPDNDAVIVGGSLTLTGTPKDILTRMYALFHDIQTPTTMTLTWETTENR